jgi:MFS family permease
MSSTSACYQELTDTNGRVYRVGETPEDIMGRSRAYMVWLPWIAMMAVSPFEYAWGAAVATLRARNGWTLTETFWIAGLWVIFQAGIAFPAGRLREKGILPARSAMLVAAVLCGLGFFTIGQSGNLTLAFIGYSIVGGIGSGLVYATCINMVGKWYPESRGARTGFVNGGFAYGAIPFIYLFSYVFTKSSYTLLLSLMGLYMVVAVALCGWFFRDPPKNWWPAHVDPLDPTRGRKSARSLAKNPPAVRQYATVEAIRTGMLPLMWLCLVIIGGVSLFGIAFQVPFAKASGFGAFVAAASASVLALINGTGRALVGWLSDHLGRRQTLTLVLLIAGIAQFGVLYSGNTHNEWLFMIFAFVNGFATGAFYPLFAALVPDYFGENYNASNYGLVYSAKLVGGVGGTGFAAGLVTDWGYTGTYILAGCIALLSAFLTLFLRQPGREKPDQAHQAPPVTVTGQLAGS